MRKIRLYSFTLPLTLLPLMDFSLSQIPKYLKGAEFRVFVAELITQVITGVTDAAIIAFFSTTTG
jgi:hypothetical protein